jgi:citrate lyase subunit beta/citryl-CoA lyase
MLVRPRRSVLYMPGSNARAIEKARTLPVDAVVLDLEDSIAPEAKNDARQQVRHHRRRLRSREVVVHAARHGLAC